MHYTVTMQTLESNYGTFRDNIPISAIADGYLVGTNAYDGNVYAFHRGPTATTVSAPMTSVTAGHTQ